MRAAQKILFAGIPVAFAAGMLFSCNNDIEKVNMLTQDTAVPIQSSNSIELIYTDSARMRLRITAPTLDRYAGKEDGYIEFPKGVKVEFFDQFGEVETELTSNYAIQHEKEGKMEARNDVVVINENGDTLNTEHLVWMRGEQKIYSYEFVKITTEDEIIFGDSLEANEDFTEYKIYQIKGIIRYEEEETTDSTETQ